MIIIFCAPSDVHGLVVGSFLARELRKDVLLLNTADYPTKWNVDLCAGSHNEFAIKSNGRRVASAEIEGVWRRRCKPHEIHSAVTDRAARQFCFTEARSFLTGLMNACDNIINRADADARANDKTLQLRIASDVGLRIPDTLVSSDPTEIRAFYTRHLGNVIYKVLTNTEFQFSETRILHPSNLDFIESAVFAPTIYQEKIIARQHLRITMVDKQLFAASITARNQYATIDWRLDPDPIISPIDLPEDVNERLWRLMDVLGLRYGAVDMILTPAGEYVFLEVNPGGQYLFVEIATGQPISLALAGALCAKPVSVADSAESPMTG